MFPIRDSVPNDRTPVVVYGLIAVNALVFLVQISLPPFAAVHFTYGYGLVPEVYFQPDGALRPGVGTLDMLPFLTATFMHGGWLHVILNMWTLFIFGSTLEGRLGSMQFLIFYLCCAGLSTYAHGYFNATSEVPVIGASGAIAGVIGAYAVRFPTARITLLVPIVIIPLIFTIPALAYAAIWFGIQLLQGTWDIFMPSMGGGIAWWAHIGGFVAGLVLLPVFLIFAPAPRPPTVWERGPWDYPD
jgi:membrane associated rhomboid family serine protease